MIQKIIARSLLQLAAITFATAVFMSAPAHAMQFNCDDLASQCSQMCGTNITTTVVNTWCTQYWPDNTCMTWAHQYSFSYGSGILNFECDEI